MQIPYIETVIAMNEVTVDVKSLPETLLKLIRTERVTLSEASGEITLRPVYDADHIASARGSLASFPDMSVDKFLERKHADKDMDL